MSNIASLRHSRWEGKHHLVWIARCRRKALYEQLRVHPGEVFRELACQKESRIVEVHLLADHVHMLISIPPKYALSPACEPSWRRRWSAWPHRWPIRRQSDPQAGGTLIGPGPGTSRGDGGHRACSPVLIRCTLPLTFVRNGDPIRATSVTGSHPPVEGDDHGH